MVVSYLLGIISVCISDTQVLAVCLSLNLMDGEVPNH